MIIPYEVDVSMNRTPYANYLIMIAMTVAFALQMYLPYEQMKQFILNGWSVAGLGGYMWLHTGFIHIIVNLVFLWVFGNAVCAKLGNVLYPLVYVGTGLLAGVVHIIFGSHSVIGASGALYGIIGIYLMLYPFNSIKCFFAFVIYIRRFSIAGLWVILWWVILNILGATTGFTTEAYFAHIGGFVSGVIAAIIMLKVKLVVRDSIDDVIMRSLRI